jgi:ectoine hydroxylase-related dioxygenase (phytanoyl-CoA dioxygenase family)
MVELKNNKILNHYRDEGFVVVKLFDIETLNLLKAAVISVMTQDKKYNSLSSNDSVLDDARRELVLRYSNDIDGKKIKDRLRILSFLPALVSLAGNTTIYRLLQELKLEEPIISSNPEFRTDFPVDKTYMQPWHQDWLYSQTSLNSVTIWTPLHDVRMDDGALFVCPGTHQDGIQDFVVHTSPRKFEMKRSDSNVERQVTIKFGESIIFSQLLHHKSGLNISDKVRLSFQLRFADADNIEWIKSGYYKADKNVTKLREMHLN